VNEKTVRKAFKKAGNTSNVKITPQILREWFCQEMGESGIPDRYVDAFCGRTPKSILARHYTDYSHEKLKEIYDKANLRVLSHYYYFFFYCISSYFRQSSIVFWIKPS